MPNVTVVEVDIRQILRDDSPIDAETVDQLAEAICGSQVAAVRQETQILERELEAKTKVPAGQFARLGLALHLLGQHRRACSHLARAAKSALAAFYHGLSLLAMGRYEAAEQQLESAEDGHPDPVECILRRAESIRVQNRIDEAEDLVRSVAKNAAGRAEYVYQIGCILADRGDTYGAIEYFERAVDMDPHHSRALFRLAGEHSSRGNDEEAIRLYEQSLSKPPFYLAAMLNLGLLYEDNENYAAAAYCFRRVLEFDPNHQRARLYLKDIDATREMYYDEESARNEARLQQLLSRPVTDFELSVRSRNCLQSMNIYTLGDLTEISEQDLLGGKNFGETSLHEIRDMMSAHGLQIGQNLHKVKTQDPFYQQQNLSPQEQQTLAKPITELQLSVRARKCMTRLGITTIGELVHRTPDELLSSRNFGVTSLNEIRSKLAEQNLKLRND